MRFVCTIRTVSCIYRYNFRNIVFTHKSQLNLIVTKFYISLIGSRECETNCRVHVRTSFNLMSLLSIANNDELLASWASGSFIPKIGL